MDKCEGCGHAAISAVFMVGAVSVNLLAGAIFWGFLRLFWYGIELEQEIRMQEIHAGRPKPVWAFWKWSAARKMDMFFPLVTDTLIFVGAALWLGYLH